MRSQPILHFWFEELTDKQHFVKDPSLNEAMRSRFGATLEAATRCELFAWRATAEGRLAEILVLDQIKDKGARFDFRLSARTPKRSEPLARYSKTCSPLNRTGARYEHNR